MNLPYKKTNPCIIAYSGPNGTGKTKAVLERVAALKEALPSKRIGFLAENMTFCHYGINGESTPERQMWIFTNHIQAELLLLQHYDLIVTDRSAVDAIAYTHALGWPDLARSMTELVRHHMPLYREINVLGIPVNATDLGFKVSIETSLIQFYRSLKHDMDFSFKFIEGSSDE